MQDSPIYTSWQGARTRCNNPGHHNYPYYGGRGIKVCERWQHFKNFLEDMGPSYKPGLTLDRIDVNGDYDPDNCRWATMTEQNRNKQKTLRYKGKTLKEWAKEIGMDYPTLRSRIVVHGWSWEKALKSPVNTYLYNGKTLTQWSQELGISKNTIVSRMREGWSPERALNTPVNHKGPKERS